jgi:hypothetical protein
MAMKHRELDKAQRLKRRHWSRLRHKHDDPEKTKQYTPQDMQSLARNDKDGNGAGVLRPNTENFHLPPNIEDISEGAQGNSPNKVLVVIVTLAIIFIAIITYFVSQMPPKN